jgi:hypothetical protein
MNDERKIDFIMIDLKESNAGEPKFRVRPVYVGTAGR